MTNRELYFSLIKENNKYFTNTVIEELLIFFNGFMDKSELLLSYDLPVKNYDEYICQRIRNGEPYQYVLGYSYFLNNKILVNKNVLIPRQETEQLVLDSVNKIKDKYKNNKVNILDMCTGSGVIGISIKKLIPNSAVTLVDISNEALVVARANCNENNVECNAIHSDLFSNLNKEIKFNVLVCNPPYIKDESTVDEQTLKYEPHLALFAKPYTKFYEKIFNDFKEYFTDKFLLCFEIGEDMKDDLENLIKLSFADVFYEFKQDLYGKTRFLYIWSE